jgi:hypothetical protein
VVLVAHKVLLIMEYKVVTLCFQPSLQLVAVMALVLEAQLMVVMVDQVAEVDGAVQVEMETRHQLLQAKETMVVAL